MVSSHGILAYGYRIASDDSGWLVEEADNCGELDRNWSVGTLESNPHDDDGGLGGAVYHLVAQYSAGLIQQQRLSFQDARDLGPTEAEKLLKKNTELSVVVHGHHDNARYILAYGETFEAYGYGTQTISGFAEFEENVREAADKQLNWALSELDVVPLQNEPQWLLTSRFG